MGIILTAKESEAPEPIDEGLYTASLIKTEESKGNFGEYIKFFFEIIEGKFKGIAKTYLASKKLSFNKSGKNSKLFDLVKTLTGDTVNSGYQLDIDSLLGKTCMILVKTDKTENGTTYQSVREVMPINK